MPTMTKPLIPLGTKTRRGIIKGYKFDGERYYFIVDKHNTVSLLDAYTVEDADNR